LLKINLMRVPRQLKIALAVVLSIALFPLTALLIFLFITEYRPKGIEFIMVRPGGMAVPGAGRIFSCLSWNIGYGGLGQEMDFFYDGGHRVRPPKPLAEAYFRGIAGELWENDSLDFMFLQEVDIHSKRSYGSNQFDTIASKLPAYVPALAINYNCRFIPVPPADPMGKVLSGIAVLSKYHPASASRIAYEAVFPLPKRLVFLKRCFLVMRFPLPGGRELVMVNLHNSTFDVNGELRMKELSQLGQFLESEYRDGHYVVAGGDWNMNPRGFVATNITTGDRVFEVRPSFDQAFLPGWSFVFDPSVPSNRNVDQPYSKGITGTTVIDFFVVSPNVDPLTVKTLNKGFRWTDHNPILMTFKLR
jgi:endonuclease/exonuclease/phosphatase family metal-dependent hydrolase